MTSAVDEDVEGVDLGDEAARYGAVGVVGGGEEAAMVGGDCVTKRAAGPGKHVGDESFVQPFDETATDIPGDSTSSCLEEEEEEEEFPFPT